MPDSGIFTPMKAHHEYRGFVVKATANALKAFKIATSEFGPQPTVEDNGPVEILG